MPTWVVNLLVVGGLIGAGAIGGYAVVKAVTDDEPAEEPRVEKATGPPQTGELPVIRALGDSVTGAFGYYGEHNAVPQSEIFNIPNLVEKFVLRGGRCLPPDPPDGRCQAPNDVAYPAVFASQLGVPRHGPFFRNDAVSGSEPKQWLGPPFEDELEAAIADDPDLIVLTLGANPLLAHFMSPTGQLCARIGAYLSDCIRKHLEKEKVVERLTQIYLRLLHTPRGGPRGTVAVMNYHQTVPDPLAPVPFFGLAARVDALFGELRKATAQAVANARSSDPANASRLKLIDPPPFAEHGCRSRVPWVLKSDGCIHPNEDGHTELARALRAVYTGRRGGGLPATHRVGEDPLQLSVDDTGEILSVAGFDPQQYLSEDPGSGVAPTVGSMVRYFGPPASRGAGHAPAPPSDDCVISWPALRLTAQAADFGAAQAACEDTAGVQSISVGSDPVRLAAGDPGAERWTTNRGLKVGDSVERLERIYPEASVNRYAEHTYDLVTECCSVVDNGPIPRLQANVYDTVVIGFTVTPYGAGD